MATKTVQPLNPADDPQIVGDLTYIADEPFLRVGRLHELLDALVEREPEHAAIIAAVKAEVALEVI